MAGFAVLCLHCGCAGPKEGTVKWLGPVQGMWRVLADRVGRTVLRGRVIFAAQAPWYGVAAVMSLARAYCN